MDIQTAARAKSLLDEINKQELELKNFVPNHKEFRIYFANDKLDAMSNGIFKSDLHTSLNQDEFDMVIKYIKSIMSNKIDNLKNQLNKL